MADRARDDGVTALTRPSSGGFTLLEVLVALTILAMAFGATLELFRLGLQRLPTNEAYTRAALIARREFATLGLDTGWRLGSSKGREGQLVWQIDVVPYAEAAAGLASRPDVTAVSVMVHVWSPFENDELLALDGIRLLPTAMLRP